MPCDDIKDSVSQFRKTISYMEDIVIGARYPYCSIRLEFIAT